MPAFNDRCPICWEQDCNLVLSCGHAFHSSCCDHLRTVTCPVCRQRVTWPEVFQRRILRNCREDRRRSRPGPILFRDRPPVL